MKIAILSVFHPYRGGISQFNALLYRELEKKHEVRAFNFTRQYPDFLFPGKTQYVTESDHADAIPNERLLDSINPFSYYRIVKKINQFKPDLLLVRFWMPFFAPCLGYIAGKIRQTGTRIIAILDNVIPHESRPGDRLLLKYFLNRCDDFVVMSKSVQKELDELKPNARSILKPHPIYEHFGIPVDKQKALKKLDLTENKKYLLFFGFIRKYKGLDTLIKSMPFLPDSYILIIAGEMYGDFTPYQTMIRQLKLESRIKLHIRYINDHEVPLYFSAADLCVLPYKSATQSGITQIAFNFNLPVICTDVGGLAEMVTDGYTGYVIKGNDPEVLGNKILKYFTNNQYESFSRHIISKKDDFSWNNFAQSLLEFVNIPEKD